MRPLAVMLLPLALVAACAVPDVSFVSADADPPDGGNFASVDAGGSADATGTVAYDTGATDGAASDARGDGDPEDAPYDGPLYCTGPGSKPPPGGGKCCPMNGGPCYGTCNGTACAACGDCTSPHVCCTSGPLGVCQMPPCPPGA